MGNISILHIYKFYYPYIGGIEKTIQMVAENLKDERFKSKILVCTHNRSFGSTEELIGSVEVSRANSLGVIFSTPISISFFINFLRLSKHADILHLHSPFPLGEICYLLFNPKRQRLVVTFHADISETRWACFAPFYKYALMALLEKADRIIVTSTAILESSHVLQPFLNKCQVIPLAIDIKKFNLTSIKNKTDLRTRLKIGNDKVILFVGRLTYQKGIDYLLEAMQKINARLIIIGSGDLKESLEEKSSLLGMRNKVHFMGQVSEDELPTYYSIADVFVLPSITAGETFGIVQLEAMALGIPVVNTNLPTGVTFVSPNNETGLTVPPRDSFALANAINKILQDDELRQRLSENGKMRIKLFSLDRMLNETRKVYEKLMEQP